MLSKWPPVGGHFLCQRNLRAAEHASQSGAYGDKREGFQIVAGMIPADSFGG